MNEQCLFRELGRLLEVSETPLPLGKLVPIAHERDHLQELPAHGVCSHDAAAANCWIAPHVVQEDQLGATFAVYWSD